METKERKGVVYNLPIDEYHGGPEISNTALSAACRSLAHYQSYKQTDSDIGAKTAQDGNLIHCAVLEPLEFDKRYIVAPKFDMRTTVGKTGAAAFDAASNGRERITQEQHDMAFGALKNIIACPELGGMMDGGRPEVSIFWQDSESGLDCRIRPDLLIVTGKRAIDVKSTEDCRAFQKSVIQYGYHRQESFYREGCREVGIEIEDFLFLVIEKKPPFDFMIYRLDADLVDVGYRQWREALNGIALANFSGVWPGYDHSIQTVDKPAWMA